ncbi:MAG: hypothetical protein R2825_11170 [Saprospiraceae bacterium]
MKNPVIIILLGIATMFAFKVEGQVFDIPSEVYAELSKPEKKQWKKAAKEYKRNPKALKVLTKEHDFYQTQATNLKTQVAMKDQSISNLEMEISSLEMELKGITDLTENTLDLSGAVEKGVVFKLQVGAFEKVKLPEDLNDAKNLATEDKSNVQKILLGKFRDYDMAKKFQGYLKEMGLKDAWIVSYKDGVRVPIEEAIHNNKP